MRILRTIFFLGAIPLLMPSPPEEARRSSLLSAAPEVSAPEVIDAASRTVSDMGDFCGRQPMVCRTADFIAGRLEAKAKYGVRLIYEWANEASSARGDQEAFEPDATASLPRFAENSAEPSENTLRVEDLIPDWRDPEATTKG